LWFAITLSSTSGSDWDLNLAISIHNDQSLPPCGESFSALQRHPTENLFSHIAENAANSSSPRRPAPKLPYSQLDHGAPGNSPGATPFGITERSGVHSKHPYSKSAINCAPVYRAGVEVPQSASATRGRAGRLESSIRTTPPIHARAFAFLPPGPTRPAIGT
jgi:hypothetical protein